MLLRIILVPFMAVGICGGLSMIANVIIDAGPTNEWGRIIIVLTVLIVGLGTLGKLADHLDPSVRRRPTVAQIRAYNRRKRCGG